MASDRICALYGLTINKNNKEKAKKKSCRIAFMMHPLIILTIVHPECMWIAHSLIAKSNSYAFTMHFLLSSV